MDRTTTSDQEFARVAGPTCCFGGCSELCCDQPFAVRRVNKDGKVEVDIGDIATITKKKPKNFSGIMTELLTDSDLYELEIHDTSITPQQRARSSARSSCWTTCSLSATSTCAALTATVAVHRCFNMYCCGAICPRQLTRRWRRRRWRKLKNAFMIDYITLYTRTTTHNTQHTHTRTF